MSWVIDKPEIENEDLMIEGNFSEEPEGIDFEQS